MPSEDRIDESLGGPEAAHVVEKDGHVEMHPPLGGRVQRRHRREGLGQIGVAFDALTRACNHLMQVHLVVEGLQRLDEILTRICEGKGRAGDIPLLEDLSEMIIGFSLCQLGGSAPNPLLSTLGYFRGEYEAHINDKKCPGGVCKALIHFEVDPEACTGCTLCARKCPVGAVSGEKKKPHVIDQEKCTRCSICYDVCKFDAVKRE